MTKSMAIDIAVKTAYLLGHAGSDLMVSSNATWRADPPLCPAWPLCPLCLDKKELWPIVCHI